MANLRIRVGAAAVQVNQIIVSGGSFGFGQSGLYKSTYEQATQSLWGDFNGLVFYINRTRSEIGPLTSGEEMNNNKIAFFMDDTNKMLPKKARFTYSNSIVETNLPNFAKSNGSILGKGGKFMIGERSVLTPEAAAVTDMILPEVITDGFILGGFHLSLFYMVKKSLNEGNAQNYVSVKVQILDKDDKVLLMSQYNIISNNPNSEYIQKSLSLDYSI